MRAVTERSDTDLPGWTDESLGAAIVIPSVDAAAAAIAAQPQRPRRRPTVGELVITQNITVDGVVEMIGDWFDPLDEGPGAAELNEWMRGLMATESAVLLGRQTFEDFRGFWPHQRDDHTGITDHLNAVQKVVVSSTLGDPEWGNTQVLASYDADAIRRVVAEAEHEVVVTGSIRLCHQLITDGLVDLYRLVVYPHVSGQGRLLFPPGTTLDLDLVDSATYGGRFPVHTYRPAS